MNKLYSNSHTNLHLLTFFWYEELIQQTSTKEQNTLNTIFWNTQDLLHVNWNIYTTIDVYKSTSSLNYC